MESSLAGLNPIAVSYYSPVAQFLLVHVFQDRSRTQALAALARIHLRFPVSQCLEISFHPDTLRSTLKDVYMYVAESPPP